MWLSSLKAGKHMWEYYQHFSSLTPSWAPKQVAQHHIQKMIDISPLLCESLLSTPAAAVGTVHNSCLFTEIIANSFMERLLCVFLPVYRFDYIICRWKRGFPLLILILIDLQREKTLLKTKW